MKWKIKVMFETTNQKIIPKMKSTISMAIFNSKL